VALAVIITALGYLLDLLLALQGVPRSVMLLLTNTLIGIVAGVLYYRLARHEKAQHEAMRTRMTTIAEVNHHIRNALQVIKGLSAFPPDPSHRDEQIQLVNESVERVEWALREVLPKYPKGPVATPPPNHGPIPLRSPAMKTTRKAGT
jgi:hypothetical protein